MHYLISFIFICAGIGWIGYYVVKKPKLFMWIIGFLGFCYLLVYIVFTIFNTHQRNSSQDSQNAKNKLPDYSDLRAIPIDDAEAHALSGNAIPHPVDDHLVTNPKILKQLNNSSHDSKIDFIPDR